MHNAQQLPIYIQWKREKTKKKKYVYVYSEVSDVERRVWELHTHTHDSTNARNGYYNIAMIH